MEELQRKCTNELAAEVERGRRRLNDVVLRPFSYARSRVRLFADVGGVRQEAAEGAAVRVGAGLVLVVELCDEWGDGLACDELSRAAAAQLRLRASLATSAARFRRARAGSMARFPCSRAAAASCAPTLATGPTLSAGRYL